MTETPAPPPKTGRPEIPGDEHDRAAAPEESSPAGAPSQQVFRRRTTAQRVGAIAGAILFLVAAGVLYVIMADLDFDEVRAEIARVSRTQIAFSVGFTTLSYLLLTGYDALALPQVTARHIRYRLTALASFTSFAVSFTLGFPLITAATVRYWIYSSVGLGASAIASLTLIAGLAFWLGMGLVIGVVMVLQPASASLFTRLPAAANGYIGFATLSAIFLYLVWIAARPRSITIQGFTLQLPRLKVSLMQTALGAADVCAACAVLYYLLPAGHGVPFATMVAAFVFACMLGVISHAPGGLGVFEATLLLALPGIPREPLLGSILLYRLFYYLVPFVIALFLLGLREIRLRSRSLRREIDRQSS